MIKIKKGDKFGRLTAVEFVKISKSGKYCWLFQCDCGKQKVIQTSNVIQGNTKSCGCIKTKQSASNVHAINGSNLVYNIEKNIIKKNNITGCTGVSYIQERQKYYASIYYKGKSYGLGKYDKLEDAIAARKAAEDEVIGGTFDSYIERKKKG